MPITRRVKPIHIFPGSTQQFSKYAVQPTGWLSARDCTMPKAILEHILEGPIVGTSRSSTHIGFSRGPAGCSGKTMSLGMSSHSPRFASLKASSKPPPAPKWLRSPDGG